MALPAHANTQSGTDATGDPLDPILTVNNSAKFHTASPSSDITAWNLTSNTTTRQLTASITVKGNIPADGASDPTGALYEGPHATALADTGVEYPGYKGGTYLVAYADTRTERNTYNLTPGCTNAATGKPIYDFQESWQDGYRDYIGASVEYNGASWTVSPVIGRFDPTEQGGYTFIDLKSEPAMNGKWSFAQSGSNISITVNTDVTTSDTTCAGGVFHSDYGNTGDTLASVTAETSNDQVVTLPVALPTSVVPGQSNLQAIGGLVSASDWAPEAGFNLGTAGPYSETGPTCPTPTFGGLLPRNPLFTDGAPCNVINPVPGGGGGYTNSGVTLTY